MNTSESRALDRWTANFVFRTQVPPLSEFLGAMGLAVDRDCYRQRAKALCARLGEEDPTFTDWESACKECWIGEMGNELQLWSLDVLRPVCLPASSAWYVLLHALRHLKKRFLDAELSTPARAVLEKWYGLNELVLVPDLRAYAQSVPPAMVRVVAEVAGVNENDVDGWFPFFQESSSLMIEDCVGINSLQALLKSSAVPLAIWNETGVAKAFARSAEIIDYPRPETREEDLLIYRHGIWMGALPG